MLGTTIALSIAGLGFSALIVLTVLRGLKCDPQDQNRLGNPPKFRWKEALEGKGQPDLSILRRKMKKELAPRRKVAADTHDITMNGSWSKTWDTGYKSGIQHAIDVIKDRYSAGRPPAFLWFQSNDFDVKQEAKELEKHFEYCMRMARNEAYGHLIENLELELMNHEK